MDRYLISGLSHSEVGASEEVRVTVRGRRPARGVRRLPPAFARIAEAMGAGAAARQALERGERDLAAGLVAERIRVADALEVSYGVPWSHVVEIILRVAASSPDERPIAAWPLIALAERLGYVDGLGGRTIGAMPSDNECGGADTQAYSNEEASLAVLRLRRVAVAYLRGQRYGDAERELARRGRG